MKDLFLLYLNLRPRSIIFSVLFVHLFSEALKNKSLHQIQCQKSPMRIMQNDVQKMCMILYAKLPMAPPLLRLPSEALERILRLWPPLLFSLAAAAKIERKEFRKFRRQAHINVNNEKSSCTQIEREHSPL